MGCVELVLALSVGDRGLLFVRALGEGGGGCQNFMREILSFINPPDYFCRISATWKIANCENNIMYTET